MNDRNAERLASFKRLTPEQRDYDRFVARRIPFGADWQPETKGGMRMADEIFDCDNESRGCTCMMAAPCSFCTGLTEVEADILWNDGMDAMLKHRRAREQEQQAAGF